MPENDAEKIQVPDDDTPDLLDAETQPETPEPQGDDDGAEGTQKKGFDKVRQQVQQELSNRDKALLERIDKLEAALAEARSDKERRAIKEEIKDQRDELDDLAGKTGQPIDPDETVPMLARKIREIAEDNKRLRGEIESQRQSTADAQRMAYESRWKSQFAQVNPDHADKADEAYRAFMSEVTELVGDGSGVSRDAQARIAQRVYTGVIERFATAKPGSAAPAQPTARQTPKGAKIAPTGSPNRTSGRASDDDDEIPDFTSR